MLKRIKPTTPGQRHVVRIKVDTEGGSSRVPLSLRVGKRQKSGRNNRGRITVRHRGGGKKRLLRRLRGHTSTRGRKNPLRESSGDTLCKVLGIQYDPNRTARLALVSMVSNDKGDVDTKPRYGYMLAAEGLKVGDVVKYEGVESSKSNMNVVDEVTVVDDMMIGEEMKKVVKESWSMVGSTRKLKSIPIGSSVFNIELVPGKGGKYVRTAGASAMLLRKPDGKALLRLPSGSRIQVSLECTAIVGRVAGEEHRMEMIGKAGRMRNRGWRPTVRGEAMNPVDHPHGGRTRGGRPEVTPWGRIAKGKKTRNSKKTSLWLVTK